MSDAFTSYIVDNDKKFRGALARAAEVSTDLRVPFGLILKDFYKSEQAIFKLQGAGKYPPFKTDINGNSAYQEKKKKDVGFDYPLLVRTGALAASVLGAGNKGSIAKITNLSLTFGTSISYGVYHQSDEPRSKIPLRKFLFIGAEAPRFATGDQIGRLQRWQGYLQDHIERMIVKSGAAT